jgi:hypothetical protein
MWPVAQTTFVLAFFSITVRFPSAWPFLFPVLLVTGDAYPLTGQLVIQEYDSMLLGSLAGWVMRCGNHEGGSNSPESIVGLKSKGIASEVLSWRGILWILGPWILLALSVSMSMIFGWSRLPAAPFGDQLSVYFTKLNSIRIAKGYVWGMVFAVCMLNASLSGKGPEWRNRFGVGIKFAMLYVGWFVLLERWLYESLFDFTREFRASGPFFTMHVGDQHLDAFLALAIPFAFVLPGQKKTAKAAAIGSGLLILTMYAAIATMSRGMMAAIVIEVILISIVTAFKIFRRISSVGIRLCIGIVAASFLAIPVCGIALRGVAFRQRIETVQTDWLVRVNHWKRILALPGNGWTDCLVGHGMGTTPTAIATNLGLEIPPVSWSPDRGGSIELKGNWPLFLEQTRWFSGFESAPADFELLQPTETSRNVGSLQFFRCYKSVFHSFEMTQKIISLQGDSPGSLNVALPNPLIDEATPIQRRWRPQSFGVSLSIGSATLRNSARIPSSHSFDPETSATSITIGSKSSAPWFFTCDNHLVWRAMNFFVHIYYEHGLLGLVSMTWFGVLCFSIKTRELDSVMRSDITMARISLIGFAVVACFGTLIDTPWIVALLLAIGAYHQSFSTDLRLQSLEVS